MKKNRTILRQLLLNILVPVLGIFTVVFFYAYKTAYDQMQNNIASDRQHILQETRNLTSYFDFSIRQHELQFVNEMHDMAFSLRKEFASQDAKTINLYELSKKLGIDTSYQHIYIINRNLQIVNTTFQPDLGLDFKKLNTYYETFFGKIFKEDVFKEDRFGLEMKTGKIKKYAFLPTTDGKYVIEIGFYSKQADEYRSILLSTIQGMGKRFKSIESVNLYLGIKNVPDVRMTNKREIKAYLDCLAKEKNQVLLSTNPTTKHNEKLEFCFLPVRDSKLYSGYVLEIKSNDAAEKELLVALIWYFTLSFLIATGILATLVYWRARKITKPISILSQQTQNISTNNLESHLKISGSSELELLSDNFNSMIDKLRVSYEELEDKVIERTAELAQQKDIVEHKNKEILDSIAYAQFIQQALLPTDAEIQEFFSDSFVYFEPKDIIAGDFYWFEHLNDISWFAVADCTGHGVPGAMVSVLCINSLRQALIEEPKSTTGELLDSVRKKVVATFTSEENAVKDGMDISICAYNHSTKELQWSGANNPLWIYREEEILIFAPNKQPIGHYENAVNFETNKIQLQKNDLIYLFSDGFADQFGGPKGKKYKYAPMKELVSSNKDKPCNELKNLLSTEFNLWKGETEQTDDVCIMGIRID